MSKELDKRWLRWDIMINEGNYISVIEEFDEIIKNNGRVVMGDLVRRNHALEFMGVASLSEKQYEREINGKSKKRKY